VTANLAVQFSGSDSYDPDGQIVAYYWDYDDGSRGEGTYSSNVYYEFGSYTVMLQVYDNLGATGSSWRPLSVQPALGPGMDFDEVRFARFNYLGANLAEYITVVALVSCDLYGYSVVSSSGQRFTFNRHTYLEPGEEAVLYSCSGIDDSRVFYWGSFTEIWDDKQGSASLYDPSGQRVVDWWSYAR